MAVTNAAGKGDIEEARQAADRALKIATEQNWPQLKVATWMALGAGYLTAGDTAGALGSYRSAHQAVAGSDDPAAPKLVVQSRFAEAAVLVGDKQYAEAAEIYQTLGPQAAEQQDQLATLEAWRMAAFCLEVHRDPADRFIIASAIQENCPVVTADGKFSGYDIEIIF